MYCRGIEVSNYIWLASSLIECPPATQVAVFQYPAETCLSRGALFEYGENSI
jgi:hypothetical protein